MYPMEDSPSFTGIDFPTPVSQSDKLEKQNPNHAINVFGWENKHVIVYRTSETYSAIPRINLMLFQQGENTRYSHVKRLTALSIISVNFVCMATQWCPEYVNLQRFYGAPSMSIYRDFAEILCCPSLSIFTEILHDRLNV